MARILHVITGLRTGGAEVMLHKLLSASSAQYQHSVISLGAPRPLTSRIADLGIPVHSLDLSPAAPSPFKISKLCALARQIAPDLITGWMYHGNLMASLAGAATGRSAVIWAIHASVDGAKRKLRTRAVIRVCARLSHRPYAIVYVSDVSRVQHENRGFHAARSLVIPNGTDCREFAPDPKARVQLHKELRLDESSVLVGLIARLHPMKDHRGFLQAAAIVARHRPNARFLLVGRDIDKDAGLRRLVHELALGDKVLLQGERSDMPRIAAGLDIACCASAWGEAFSKAIGEAMACAVPCVVTDVGDNKFLVGETGLSVPPGEPRALARALDEMISAGPAERSKSGSAARRRIEQNFSLPAIVARYEELYARHISSVATTMSNGVKNLDPALRA